MKLQALAFIIVSALGTSTAFAQTPVSHNKLAADFYAADGSTAIMLLHGTLAHNRMEIIKTVASLVAEDYGYPVITPNLSFDDPNRMGEAIRNSSKGYTTLTACDIEHRYDYFDALRELTNWVDYLEKKGFEKIIVAGHSRGGRQVSAFLADSPSDKIVGGVLIAAGTSDPEKNTQSYFKSTGLNLPDIIQQAKAMDPSDLLQVPKFIYCDNPKVTARTFISEYESDVRHNTLFNLEKINMPILIIGGSEDTVVPDIKNIFSEITKKDNVSLQMIDGADHFFRDLYADDIAAAIADMVESIK
ncbi:alpha/beta hydrolase [Litorivicinus sp.]|nr:alpha/beta hydrolase [Litorivicinus sp.]